MAVPLTSIGKNLAFFSVLCLPAVAVVAPAEAQNYDGQSANECLSISEDGLENSCSFTVNAVWCVENIDCRGQFSNNVNIVAYGSYPYNGRQSGNQIRYAACRGRDTASSAPGYTFRCRKEY